jgi:hypothetical protein
MAYVTTDTDIATILTVRRKSSITHYSILDAFGTFAAISISNWQRLIEASRQKRLAAFISMVEATEGINIEDTQTNEPTRPSLQEGGEPVD